MLLFAPEDLGRSDPVDRFVHKTGTKALMTTVVAGHTYFSNYLHRARYV